MAVPPPWNELDPASKRERLLTAAGGVFASLGIEAPMPVVAAEAGTGIGSVYRQFPSKEDLVAALVVRRLETVLADIEAALRAGGEAGRALRTLLCRLADRQADDDVVAEAMATVSERVEVAEWTTRCERRLEELIARARAEGALRADASAGDVRLLLAAVRGARRADAGPAPWRRILELGLDGLAARPAVRPAAVR